MSLWHGLIKPHRYLRSRRHQTTSRHEPANIRAASTPARRFFCPVHNEGCANTDDDIDGDAGTAGTAPDETQYVYENHPDFGPLPSFPLSLSFSAVPAEAGASYVAGIRPFPPHTMKNILPRQFISADSDFEPSSCPILHIAQNLSLHKPIPMPELQDDGIGGGFDQPIGVKLVTSIVSVVPKEIGVFVTSETEYWTTTEPPTLLFTGVSTALVVGAPKEAIMPFRSATMRSKVDVGAVSPKEQDTPPSYEITFRIKPNQALLYRLSGDYNAIHVDSDLAEMAMGNHNRNGRGEAKGMSRPVLHGLCSLGFAIRGVLRFVRQREARGDGFEVTYLSCRFVRPVYVGDQIKCCVWDDDATRTSTMRKNKHQVLRFEVLECSSGKTVIKNGQVRITRTVQSMPPTSHTSSRL